MTWPNYIFVGALNSAIVKGSLLTAPTEISETVRRFGFPRLHGGLTLV